MPDIEVFPDDDVEVIRVYKRFDTETYAFSKLRLKDFARVMAKHSGLSMWRNCADQNAMDRYKTDQLKGAARIKAKLLKNLGFRFSPPLPLQTIYLCAATAATCTSITTSVCANKLMNPNVNLTLRRLLVRFRKLWRILSTSILRHQSPKRLPRGELFLASTRDTK